MNKWFFLFAFLAAEITGYGQSRHTISGTVREKKSGETLIGASVYLLEQPKTATLSNAYDFIPLLPRLVITHWLLVFQALIPIQ